VGLLEHKSTARCATRGIAPSKKNVKTFLEKIRGIVRANQAVSAGKLIAKLNPVIRGWVNYHRHVVSKDIFSSVDEVIYQTIRRWARRRHPWKSNAWVVKKYFTSIGGNNWVFSGTVDEHPCYLTNADSVPIIRHVKIRAEANPYDPTWESYFEKRLDVHIAATLKGKRWLLTLWKEQNGLCPVCTQKITKITGWHSHHILGRSKPTGCATRLQQASREVETHFRWRTSHLCHTERVDRP